MGMNILYSLKNWVRICLSRLELSMIAAKKWGVSECRYAH